MNNANSPARCLAPTEGLRLDLLGDLITFKALTQDTNGGYCQFEGEVRAGGGVPPHHHPQEDETFYVLAGQFTFLVGGERITGDAGAYVFVPRGTVHAFQNTGDAPGRLLVTVTPGSIHEALFLRFGRPVEDASASLAPPTPDQIAAFTSQCAEFGTVLAPRDHVGH